MFSLKNKLDINVKHAISNKYYKSFRVLIRCKALQENIEKKIKTYRGTILRSIPSIKTICAVVSPQAIERLIEYPEIDYIAWDSYAFLCASSALSANNAVYSEKYKLTGKGVGVGIIDSGTFPHSDLAYPNNKIKYFLDIVNNYKYPYDDNGHGTFMSGIICGSGHLSKGMYKGIAVNCCLYSIKAFNSIGRGYISDILFALDTLINEKDKLNLKVICLPFEIVSNDYFSLSLFAQMFKRSVENNIILVVPSGHNGNAEGSIKGIAILDNCLTIGGLDTRVGTKPYVLSSSGPFKKLEKPDLSAACVDICSLNSNTDYVSQRNGMKLYPEALKKPYTNYTGTSCAAAYVAGLCALLFENNPNLTFKDIKSMLKVSCHIQDIPKRLQGSGTLDFNKLLP